MTDLTTDGAQFFRPLDVPFRTQPQQRLFLFFPCHLVDHARAVDRIGGRGGGVIGAFFSLAFPRSATYSRDRGHLYMGEAGLLFRGDEKTIQVPFEDALNLEVRSDGMKLETSSGQVHIFKANDRLTDSTIYEWNDMFDRLRQYVEDGSYIDQHLNLVLASDWP